MLIECVSEANQALYPSEGQMSGDVCHPPEMHQSWSARNVYPANTSPPTPSGDYNAQTGHFYNPSYQRLASSMPHFPDPTLRNRYIKQWLSTLRPPSSRYPHSGHLQHQQAWQHFMTYHAMAKQHYPSGCPEKKEGKDLDGRSEAFSGQSAFLGPNIWDKTLPYNDDFNLEYMDLDEFLNENGVSDEAIGNLQQVLPNVYPNQSPPQQQQQQQQQQQGNVSPKMSPLNSIDVVSVSPAPKTPEHPLAVQLSPAASPQFLPSPPALPAAAPQLSPQLPPAAPEARARFCDPDSDMKFKEEEREPSPVVDYDMNPNDLALATAPVNMVKEESCCSSMMSNESDEHFPLNDNDLALASIPGQEFDPRKRKFSVEELRPQPMIKKSRKIYVPDECKDDKYWSRRKKNNIAAKRSRDARRIKENQIALRAAFLEKTTANLREELEAAKAENQKLLERLAKYEGPKSS